MVFLNIFLAGAFLFLGLGYGVIIGFRIGRKNLQSELDIEEEAYYIVADKLMFKNDVYKCYIASNAEGNWVILTIKSKAKHFDSIYQAKQFLKEKKLNVKDYRFLRIARPEVIKQ